jgi:hypothetical protein
VDAVRTTLRALEDASIVIPAAATIVNAQKRTCRARSNARSARGIAVPWEVT